MGRSIRHLGFRVCHFAAALAVCLATGALMLAASRPAFSQTAGPPVQAPVQAQAPAPAPPAAPVTPSAPVSDAPAVLPPQPPSAPPPPARPAHHPGFLEELGKVLKDSASHLSSTWKGSQKTLEDLNAKTKDATESLTRVQSVVTGRTACPVTANGAPDCVAAAEQLCKGKGFKSGKSLDIETAEKCSAKVYLSGRTGAPGECRTENFVTRAICQ